MWYVKHFDLNCLLPLIFQLEQEIDLVLEKKNVFDNALKEWSNKWVPAILEYSNSLSGKKATLAAVIRKDCEGMYYNYDSIFT